MSRVGGILYLRRDGKLLKAKGEFTYNLGVSKREAVVNHQNVDYKENPQEAYIEGAITDAGDLDVKDVLSISGETVTLETASGKTIVIRDAFYSGDGNITTDEGEIEFRVSGTQAEEVPV